LCAPPVTLLSEMSLTGGVASTTTVALLALSAPRQCWAKSGVVVYCQEPPGTSLSVQVSALTVPVQAVRIVCAVGSPAG
jgi:hypothetical protein